MFGWSWTRYKVSYLHRKFPEAVEHTSMHSNQQTITWVVLHQPCITHHSHDKFALKQCRGRLHCLKIDTKSLCTTINLSISNKSSQQSNKHKNSQVTLNEVISWCLHALHLLHRTQHELNEILYFTFTQQQALTLYSRCLYYKYSRRLWGASWVFFAFVVDGADDDGAAAFCSSAAA